MSTETIRLRAPSIYALRARANQSQSQSTSQIGSAATWQPPALPWLARTWSVTHSTLPMWRKARNVRITYTLLPPRQPPGGSGGGSSKEGGEGGGGVRLDDEVCSEPIVKTWMPQPRSIRGVDTPAAGVEAAWNWRGRGWLRIAGSYWEVLGWGEFASDAQGGAATEKEKWVVTWFQASLFTPMGVDLYSDRKEGMSEACFRMVLGALERGEAGEEVAGMCKEEMREVEIKY
ncbi:hypothetical protein BUE80_DR011019 [Diplocarpon rosae]|nr:hypothetical protein BUE80_DR011019 [Diplocarpon rosae]